tara:strand:- start:125 stop:634 length:510 start_codon:yes stop_codon:yes gene_type:complete
METKDLKIVIDLKDIYAEYPDYDSYSEAGTINDILKEKIHQEVLRKILNGFSPTLQKELLAELKEKFQGEFEEKISDRVSLAIQRGVFVKPDGKTFNIDDIAHEKMQYVLNDRSCLKEIEKSVKNHIDEIHEALKNRYDLAFASGIIKNLKEGGLLREGAEELLLKKEE